MSYTFGSMSRSAQFGEGSGGGPCVYGAQNKSLMAAGFGCASWGLSARDDMAARFSQPPRFMVPHTADGQPACVLQTLIVCRWQ